MCTQAAYGCGMVFFEAPGFTKHLPTYLTDEQLRAVQAALAANPGAGDVMPHTGGFRKLRWPDVCRGKGTRGGLRIVYYHLEEDAQVWLMAIYGKGEMADLSADQKRTLKRAIEAECKARAAKRRRRTLRR
jgi:hypothetical protein